MLDIFVTARKVIREANVHSYLNSGVLICSVNNATNGLRLAGNIITSVVDKTTVLFLSGGKTPKELYQELAQVRKLHPGAIGLVDERYAEEPMHKESNEKMLADTGFLSYCKYTSIPVYLYLRRSLSREETARAYNEEVRKLFATYSKHIAIFGVGLDGHTAGLPASAKLWQAGLPAQNAKLKTQNSKIYTTTELVTEYNDESGKYGERITMTFLALSMMDLLLVLVFGKEKKNALELMFSEGSEEEVPARFYKRPAIAVKTILLTDQAIL